MENSYRAWQDLHDDTTEEKKVLPFKASIKTDGWVKEIMEEEIGKPINEITEGDCKDMLREKLHMLVDAWLDEDIDIVIDYEYKTFYY